MEQMVTRYLHLLNIPVSGRYLEKRLASHPDYPSLLSISDTLEQLGIPFGVFRTDKEKLENIDAPYLLHLDKGGEMLITIANKADLKSQQNLLDNWSGIVLKAEYTEAIIDRENRDAVLKEKAVRSALGAFIIFSLLVIAVVWFQSISWIFAILLFTAIAGCVLGYLLIAKDLGVKYDAVESFCNAGKRAHCDRVLYSNEAVLFWGFTLSDTVLSYFAAQLTVIGLLIPLSGNVFSLLSAVAAMGVFTLPVVGYSFWLQGAVFKIWCRLCLLVSGLLILQAGLFSWMDITAVVSLADISLWGAGLVVCLHIATGSLVFLLKTRLKEGVETEQSIAEANRVKYNPSVFFHMLVQQRKAECSLFEEELLIGSSGANVQIMMAASTGCTPCKIGFEKVIQIVNVWPGIANLAVRFNFGRVPVRDKNVQAAANPGLVLLERWQQDIAGREDKSEQTESLIREWYSHMDIAAFQAGYPSGLNGLSSTALELISRHNQWFEHEGITRTPTFFINGYRLPEAYRIDDLLMLIPGIADIFQREKAVTLHRKIEEDES